MLMALAGPVSAARLVLAPESHLWLEGDSTLHVYHSTATELRAGGEMDSLRPFPMGAIAGFELVVPVKGLKSGKSGLDKNMHGALKAKEFPEIVYRLSHLTAAKDPAGVFHMKTVGTLTVAGREKDVTVEGVVRVRDGGFQIQGRQKLLMTDFGVKPPVMMMGTIRTKNEVTIHYDIVLVTNEETKQRGGDHEIHS
jgi:hypothetical protein